ncbi:MAG: type II toxin-antitoxin system RelE family toxin [Pyrinomonadaceae bacterium]
MKVEFLKRFSRDLDEIPGKSVRSALKKVIELMENTDSLAKVPGIKKLQGHKTAYRIRVGDYRLGFFFENETVLLARFVNRKDIYKLFP